MWSGYVLQIARFTGEREESLSWGPKSIWFSSNNNFVNTFLHGPCSWFFSQPLLCLHLTMQTARPIDQRPACNLQTPFLPLCLISQCWHQYTVQHYRVCFPLKPWGLRILLFQCCLFSGGMEQGRDDEEVYSSLPRSFQVFKVLVRFILKCE